MAKCRQEPYHWPYNAVFCVMKFHADQYSDDPLPRREAADHSESSELNWQLFSAADRGYVEEVKQSLERGADPNFQHCAGTPLIRAARRGHLACVEALLDHGAEPNTPGRFNCQTCTALHASASNGHLDVVKLLLDREADIDTTEHENTTAVDSLKGLDIADRGGDITAKRDQGSTPLHDAAKFGHGDIALLLLQRGASVNAKNSRGKTPLFLAASEGRLDGLRWVLEAVIEYYHFRGFCYNPDFYPQDPVEHLFRNKDKVNALSLEDLKDLRAALLNDDLETTKTILQEREPDSAEVIERHQQLVQCLLEAGADPEIEDCCETGPLEEAILNNNIQSVKLLIQYGAKFNRVGTMFGWKATPLHFACDRGNEEMVEFLLENGADANGVDYKDQTPLHFSMREGNIQYVQALLKHGANIHALDDEGNTPLHLARTADCARLLVEHGADVKALNKKGRTVLFTAADKNGEGACVRYLIEQGVDPLVEDEDKISALDLAVKRWCSESEYWYYNDDGGVEAASALMDHGAKLKNTDDYLDVALKRRRLGLAVALLRAGASVNKKTGKGNETPLWTAASCNFVAGVKWLLMQGADMHIKCQNMTPLRIALLRGMEGSAKVLMEAGAVPDSSICNSTIAMRTYVELLKQVSDINRQHEDGVAVIHLMCIKPVPIKALKTLLECGADVNIADKEGVTALHTLAFNNHAEHAELLMEKASVNQQDRQGYTALHYTAFKGFTKTAKLLFEHGADPNLRDIRGRTPTHIACQHLAEDKAITFLELLVSYGAHVDMKDEGGCTPFQEAQKRQLIECMKFLLNHGAVDTNPKPHNCIQATFPEPFAKFLQYITQDEESDDEEEDLGFGLFD